MLTVREWMANSIDVHNVNEFIHNAQSEQQHYWPTEAGTWQPHLFGTTSPLPNGKTLPMAKALIPYLDPNHPQFKQNATLVESKKNVHTDDEVILLHKVALMRRFIKKSGYTFQGDTESLAWMLKHSTPNDNPLRRLGIGFIILHDSGNVQCDIVTGEHDCKLYIILYYSPGHWTLGGYAVGKNQVKTVLSVGNFPPPLREKLKRECSFDIVRA
jgi:hypothetical protein